MIQLPDNLEKMMEIKKSQHLVEGELKGINIEGNVKSKYWAPLDINCLL